MAASEKPYSFQPVYAIEQAIDLGTRLVNGSHGLTELKDASGILGCALEKLDGDDQALALASFDDVSGLSLEQLGERLQAMPAVETEEAIPWSLLLPIIMQIIQLLLGRFGGGGSSPSPGPV